MLGEKVATNGSFVTESDRRAGDDGAKRIDVSLRADRVLSLPLVDDVLVEAAKLIERRVIMALPCMSELLFRASGGSMTFDSVVSSLVPTSHPLTPIHCTFYRS